MAEVETSQEKGTGRMSIGGVDVLVGVGAATNADQVRQRAAQALQHLRGTAPDLRIAVAIAGAEHDASATGEAGEGLLEYPLPQGGAGGISAPISAPWLNAVAAYRPLAELAARVGARACVIVAPDLAALEGGAIERLAGPVLADRAELTMPLYTMSKFEGLLNSGLLYPLTRALFGRRVRYPLGPDFGVTTRLLAKIAASVPPAAAAQEHVVWPAVEATRSEATVAQVHLDGRHAAQRPGASQGDSLDLSTVLRLLAGSCFADAERHAVFWQRVRASQQVRAWGEPAPPQGDEPAVDARAPVESFQLAWRNLQEVWGLVLPPVSLVELKRLARLGADEFVMPDALWARIVYDFALAYRLRTISRAHLLGALTPLYLGWAASHVREISAVDAYAAEQRVEGLARAFEDAKPYFVSRWRWPDRFNP